MFPQKWMQAGLLLICAAGCLSFKQQAPKDTYCALIRALIEAKSPEVVTRAYKAEKVADEIVQKITRLLDQGADPNIHMDACAVSELLPGPRHEMLALLFLLKSPSRETDFRMVKGKLILLPRLDDRQLTHRLVRLFLSHGANPNARGTYPHPPLMQALFYKYEDSAMALLEKGAHVNTQDTNGNTPLMSAPLYPRIWKELLKRGADVAATDIEGGTPLHKAAFHHDTELMNALLARKAPANVPNHQKERPLHVAAVHADTAAVQALLKSGAEIEVRDEQGETPLLLSIFYDNLRNARVLIEAGANVNAVNNEGITPLMHAAMRR
jgi:ankyrin repeat protein